MVEKSDVAAVLELIRPSLQAVVAMSRSLM